MKEETGACRWSPALEQGVSLHRTAGKARSFIMIWFCFHSSTKQIIPFFFPIKKSSFVTLERILASTVLGFCYAVCNGSLSLWKREVQKSCDVVLKPVNDLMFSLLFFVH